jgi:hypothetical protein
MISLLYFNKKNFIIDELKVKEFCSILKNKRLFPIIKKSICS